MVPGPRTKQRRYRNIRRHSRAHSVSAHLPLITRGNCRANRMPLMRDRQRKCRRNEQAWIIAQCAAVMRLRTFLGYENDGKGQHRMFGRLAGNGATFEVASWRCSDHLVAGCMIARLERLTGGRILLNGEELTNPALAGEPGAHAALAHADLGELGLRLGDRVAEDLGPSSSPPAHGGA